jgi:hypothetical protein
MRVLLAAALCTCVTPAQAAVHELSARGAALFEARCAGVCHQTPQAARLTAKQWQVVLATMRSRMQQTGLPPLTEDEQRAILHFLTQR